jgi:hypothetical protein
MSRRERGIALVTVLLLLALLLVLGLVLGERVIRTNRDSACNGAREQALQAAMAAIEWVRPVLANSYPHTNHWRDYLATAGAGDRYPLEPAFRLPVGGLSVEVFLRDNPDGDDDPQRDNDLKLYVLARARTRLGPEAVVESLCGLDLADERGYAQARGAAGRAGVAAVDGPADPASAPVAGFGLAQ